MAEKFLFFDSTIDDERVYSSDDFAGFFRKFIRNGIFNGGTNLQVACEGSDMNVKIKEGCAWIEGYMYEIDSEPLSLTLDTADPTIDRIDRVVVRLDKRLESRYVKAFVLKGTPAETPTAPEITRDENIYEISLAQVRVTAGKSYIEGSQITDERLNSDVCGITTHLFKKVDTTGIFNEWQNFLKEKKADTNFEYDSFIASLNAKTSNFQANWDVWFNSIQDGSYITQDVAKQLINAQTGKLQNDFLDLLIARELESLSTDMDAGFWWDTFADSSKVQALVNVTIDTAHRKAVLADLIGSLTTNTEPIGFLSDGLKFFLTRTKSKDIAPASLAAAIGDGSLEVKQATITINE